MTLNECTPKPGTPGGQAVRTIARLARVFETRLADDAMTLPQFRLLAFLAEGERAASVLADWLAVSRPSVTALVDGLVERGWVERRPSPIDRRRVLHQITAAGSQVLDHSGAHLEESLDVLFGHLDDDERNRALEGLEQLSVAMVRHREAVTSA